MNKLIAIMLSASMLISAESFAAFGGKSVARSGGAGISRSMSRPATPTAPRSYSAPSYSAPSSSGRYYSGSSTNQYDNYDRGRYNSHNNYDYGNNRPNSAMRDIGVTAAGVAGGVLAASAIQNLIAGPHGTYTHPQYPGQYFNAQGQVVAPPSGVTYPAQQSGSASSVPQEQYIQQGGVGQQPVVVVQQKQESGLIWKMIVGVIQLTLLCSLLGGIAFGIWCLYNKFKSKQEEEQVVNGYIDVDAEFEDIDSKAMDIFYDFQRNSDNKVFLEKNTKYLPIDSCMSPPSIVEKYEHRTIDCAVEQGKLRASVEYKATLSNVDGVEEVNQTWNMEKDGGKWYLVGIEAT